MRKTATLLLCCIVLAGRAAAEPAAQRARILFGQAKVELDRGRTIDALALFVRSFEAFEHDSTMLNIAQCYRLLHRPERAIRHYEHYLALARQRRPGGTVPYAADVAGYLGELRGVVELTRQGWQLLDASEPRAALRIAQQARRLMPWTQLDLLVARAHRALGDVTRARRQATEARDELRGIVTRWTARHPRNELPFIDDIDRELSALDRLLSRLERPTRRRPEATLVLLGLPPATRIALDGGDWRPAAPGRPLEISAGRHRLAVEAPGHRPWAGAIALRPGQRVALPLDLEPLKRRCTTCLVTGIVTLALAVAAEITAIALTVHANSLFNDDPDFDRLRSGVIASHIAAGVFAVGSGIGFYLNWRRSSTPSTSTDKAAAGPAAPDSAVLGLTLRF